MGYRTKRGLPFHKCILGYLKNRVYIGEYNYHIYKSEKQQHIVLTDVIPKIIDDEIFEKVQIKLTESNPKRNTSTKPITLLKGKVYCGYTNYVLSYHLNRKTFYNETYYYDSNCKSRNGIKIVKKINADKIISLLIKLERNYSVSININRRSYLALEEFVVKNKEMFIIKGTYTTYGIVKGQEIGLIECTRYTARVFMTKDAFDSFFKNTKYFSNQKSIVGTWKKISYL